MRSGLLTLPPAVVPELLSLLEAPDHELGTYLLGLPLLPILDGYWHRTGQLRSLLRSKGRRSRLADALICQSCLDHDVPLIARDPDYRSHAQFCGLKLAAR